LKQENILCIGCMESCTFGKLVYCSIHGCCNPFDEGLQCKDFVPKPNTFFTWCEITAPQTQTSNASDNLKNTALL
jgi:hypothetical protein